MKVFSLSRYCSSSEENITEWFRNRNDAQKRRVDLMEQYRVLESRERERYEWALSQVNHHLVPETKDELIRWLNVHAARKSI